jgi:2,3-bisphosphoglycerate-independent phosphoglycerate mutase
MGNSEVGHLTIGSGRILFQDLVRVSRSIEDGSLFTNPALVAAFERARGRGGAVHLLGLVSTGGVHSHIDHLRALLTLSQRQQMATRTWVHAFTDGRDVSPHAAAADLATLPADRIATVAGRYYAMDRDRRWERTDRAVAAICDGAGDEADDPIAAIRASYARGVTDEFVEPVVLRGRPRLDPARDSAVFFNFRPDRGRQLSSRLLERGVDLTTMTRYADDLDCPVAFGEQVVADTLAETVSRAGRRQLHAAETEKYAHVTYFFNGGEESEWPGETRILVPSPRDVASYDLAPAMSAREVAQRVAAEIGSGYAFAVVNFANPDMVGHTGVIPAVVEAVEVVDGCLGTVVEATHAAGGVCLITADHGNAEHLLEDDGVSPHTAHTTNPVPLVLTREGTELRAGGELSDLAPTVLSLLGLDVPEAMTGRSLVAESSRENR